MTDPDIQQYGARGPLSDPPSLGEYVVVLYAAHVAAMEAAEQRGHDEALADFLSSVGEDDPIYLKGYRVGSAAGKDAVMTSSYAEAVAEGKRDALSEWIEGVAKGRQDAARAMALATTCSFDEAMILIAAVAAARAEDHPDNINSVVAKQMFDAGVKAAREAVISLRSGAWGTDYDGVQIDMADALAAIDALEKP